MTVYDVSYMWQAVLKSYRLDLDAYRLESALRQLIDLTPRLLLAAGVPASDHKRWMTEQRNSWPHSLASALTVIDPSSFEPPTARPIF